MNQTDLERWKESDSYLGDWQERSQLMIKLIDDALVGSGDLTFTEYGCGPNAPISKALRPSGRFCIRYDIKPWDNDCQIVNLNDPDFSVGPSDVAVMSGVAEYMNDLQSTVKQLQRSHGYLLLSYHVFGEKRALRSGDPIKEINKRSSVNGWRNHLNFAALVNTISGAAFPLRFEKYKAQTLMLWQFF